MIRTAAALTLGLWIGWADLSAARQAGAPSGEPSPAQLAAAIEKLGDLDFPTRMSAARTVRRAGAGAAVPALLAAVAEHKVSYVRFRALVLLSGFNDSRTRDVMLSVLGDRDDRVRTVAYTYFEHNL